MIRGFRFHIATNILKPKATIKIIQALFKYSIFTIFSLYPSVLLVFNILDLYEIIMLTPDIKIKVPAPKKSKYAFKVK